MTATNHSQTEKKVESVCQLIINFKKKILDHRFEISLKSLKKSTAHDDDNPEDTGKSFPMQEEETI